MADTPEALIAGQRVALSVMREALDAERARSDARLVALARIDGMRGREDADAAFGEACDIAREAIR